MTVRPSPSRSDPSRFSWPPCLRVAPFRTKGSSSASFSVLQPNVDQLVHPVRLGSSISRSQGQRWWSSRTSTWTPSTLCALDIHRRKPPPGTHRGQAGSLRQKLFEIQHRTYLRDLRRAPHVRRQEPARELSTAPVHHPSSRARTAPSSSRRSAGAMGHESPSSSATRATGSGMRSSRTRSWAPRSSVSIASTPFRPNALTRRAEIGPPAGITQAHQDAPDPGAIDVPPREGLFGLVSSLC
jgi:hypothetical protein